MNFTFFSLYEVPIRILLNYFQQIKIKTDRYASAHLKVLSSEMDPAEIRLIR